MHAQAEGGLEIPVKINPPSHYRRTYFAEFCLKYLEKNFHLKERVRSFF